MNSTHAHTHTYTHTKDAYPNVRLQARSEITILKRKRVLWESRDICWGVWCRDVMVPYYKRQTARCCLEATAIVIAMKVARDRAVWKTRSFRVFGKSIAVLHLILDILSFSLFLYIILYIRFFSNSNISPFYCQCYFFNIFSFNSISILE